MVTPKTNFDMEAKARPNNSLQVLPVRKRVSFDEENLQQVAVNQKQNNNILKNTIDGASASKAIHNQTNVLPARKKDSSDEQKPQQVAASQKQNNNILKNTIGVASASKAIHNETKDIVMSDRKEFPSTITIETPNENDILLGRGAGVHAHPGNVQYRELIQYHKLQYVNSNPVEKKQIIKYIFNIAKQLGRFLKLDPITEEWTTVSDGEARRKVGQALRENAPTIKNQNNQAEVLKRKMEFQIAQSNSFPEYLLPRPTLNLPSTLDSLTSTQTMRDFAFSSQTNRIAAPINHVWTQINILQEKQDGLKRKQRELEDDQNRLMRDLHQVIRETFLEAPSSNDRWPNHSDNESCFVQFPNKRSRVFES